MKKRVLTACLCICMALCFSALSAADSTMLQGDANGDGKVSVRDAALVLRYSVGLSEGISTRCKIQSDVNRNAKLDAEDAASILRQAAGIASLQAIPALDTSLYNKLAAHPLKDQDYTEWIARTIQYLPSGSRKKVLYAAANYLGTPYSELNCSDYLKEAFADAEINKEIYPGKSSDGVLSWFRTNHPDRLHEIASYPIEKWKPSGIVIYLNPDTGKANHVALFIGMIDGQAVITDSGTKDGVRLSELWEYAGWVPTYYADPWG